MRNFCSGFESRSIVNDSLLCLFFIYCSADLVLPFFEDAGIDDEIGQSLNLMTWDFEFIFDESDIISIQQQILIHFNVCLRLDIMKASQLEDILI